MRILLDSRTSAIITTEEHLDALSTRDDPPFGASHEKVRLADGLLLLVNREALKAAPPEAGDAIVQYTSGSTAFPRGVRVTHNNILANARLISRVLDVTSDSRALHWLPLHHDMGLMGGVLAPMFSGCVSNLLDPSAFAARPAVWLEAISRLGATISTAPNFAYQACVRSMTEADVAALDLSPWRIAVCGAEPIRRETLDAFVEKLGPAGFRASSLVPSYGLAEATLFVSGAPRPEGPKYIEVDGKALSQEGLAALPIDGRSAKTLTSCGPIHPDQEVVIVNPDGERCRPGAVGEIWIKGPSVCRGYIGGVDGEASPFEAVTADGDGGFLRTGDLGLKFDEDLYIVGRIKDLVIVRGLNHYPQDIELTAERSHSALVPNGGGAFTAPIQGEERLILVHEVFRRREAEAAEAGAALFRAVAVDHGLAPHSVVLIRQGSLPRTTSGKVQRRAVLDLFLAKTLVPLQTAGMVTAPTLQPSRAASPVEALITQIWCATLKLDQVGLDQNFFDVGGDSLLLAATHARLVEELDLSFEVTTLLEYPTIGALAAHIEALAGSRSDAPSDSLDHAAHRAGLRRERVGLRQHRRLVLEGKPGDRRS